MKYTKLYIKEIEAGNIIINKYVELQLNRMLGFEKKYIFRQEKVDIVITFFETMCHNTKGSTGLIKLQLAQKVWLEAAFGFYYEKNGELRRLVRENLWQISRGSGKTTIGGGLGLYGTLLDSEPGAEVYCFANTVAQAKILFDISQAMVGSSDDLKTALHKSTGNVLLHKENNSSFQVKASDYDSLDGLNGHIVIFDEVHAYKEPFLKVVNDGGFKKRKNPMTFYITTNGTVRDYVYDALFNRAVKVLEGQIEDDSFMPFLYMLEDKSEIRDESKWQKAIPLLHSLIDIDIIRKDVIDCDGDPHHQTEMMCKTFGLPVNTFYTYLTTEECKPTDYIEVFNKGTKTQPQNVILGVDFSQVNDICSIALVLPQQDKYYVKWLRFIPETGVEKLPVKLKVKYAQWEQLGYLVVHKEPFNSEETIFPYVRDYLYEHNLMPILAGYDQWQAQSFMSKLNKYFGSHNIPVPQLPKSLSTPLKQTKELLSSGRLLFDDPVATWTFGNLVVKVDANNNIFPNKKEANNKIDDVSSWLDAYKAYLDVKEEYEALFLDDATIISMYDGWDDV